MEDSALLNQLQEAIDNKASATDDLHQLKQDLEELKAKEKKRAAEVPAETTLQDMIDKMDRILTKLNVVEVQDQAFESNMATSAMSIAPKEERVADGQLRVDVVAEANVKNVSLQSEVDDSRAHKTGVVGSDKERSQDNQDMNKDGERNSMLLQGSPSPRRAARATCVQKRAPPPSILQGRTSQSVTRKFMHTHASCVPSWDQIRVRGKDNYLLKLINVDKAFSGCDEEIDEFEKKQNSERASVFDASAFGIIEQQNLPCAILEYFRDESDKKTSASQSISGPPSLLDTPTSTRLHMLFAHLMLGIKGHVDRCDKAIDSIVDALLSFKSEEISIEFLKCIQTLIEKTNSTKLLELGDQSAEQSGVDAFKHLSMPHLHKLLYCILKLHIPNINIRLECLIFQAGHHDMMKECEDNLNKIIVGLECLAGLYQPFQCLFSVAMQVGNSLNRGHHELPPHSGFKLSTFKAFQSVKHRNTKFSLFHLVLLLMCKDDIRELTDQSVIDKLQEAQNAHTFSVYKACNEHIKQFSALLASVCRNTSGEIEKTFPRAAENTEEIEALRKRCVHTLAQYKDLALFFNDPKFLWPPPERDTEESSDIFSFFSELVSSIVGAWQEAEQENWWAKEVRPYLDAHWKPTCRKRSQCKSCKSMMSRSNHDALVSESLNEKVSHCPTPLRNSHIQTKICSSPCDHDDSFTFMCTTPRRYDRYSKQTCVQGTPDVSGQEEWWDDFSERSLQNSTNSRCPVTSDVLGSAPSYLPSTPRTPAASRISSPAPNRPVVSPSSSSPPPSPGHTDMVERSSRKSLSLAADTFCERVMPSLIADLDWEVAD